MILTSESSSPSLASLITALAEGQMSPTLEASRKRISFYKALLQDERENMLDIEYWIEYVNKFDVGHTMPLYDKLGYVYYYNIDIYALVILALIVVWKLTTWQPLCCDEKPAKR